MSTEVNRLGDELARLYAAQTRAGDDWYLRAHSRNRAVIDRQTRAFLKYADYLRGAERMLDWGCRQAADSCLARMLFPGLRIDACDIDAADSAYREFFAYADLRYSQLTHRYELPYDDDTFDAVVGGGVLEHVPQESASLAELHRILKPEKYLVVTMLPNRYSYIEALQRLLRAEHHERLYSLREARRLLLSHGFVPVRWGYHQMLPTLSSPRGGLFDSPILSRIVDAVAGLNPALERLWPVRSLATNLFLVARKVVVVP
jgi:SAM-dependent methyltransferase